MVKVDLQTLAGDWSGRSDAYGSLLLRYKSLSSANLYAAVLVQRAGHPISFHFDAYPLDATFSAGSRESVWWLPRPSSDGFLIVSNFSPRPVDARPVFTNGASRYPLALRLGPYQTQRISIRESVRAAGFKDTQGGVKVELNADAGSVYVAQVLFDEDAEFSAIMKVFGRNQNSGSETHTLRAPLVALAVPDPMLGYPGGTVLHPAIFMRNASGAPMSAQMVVNWKSATAKGSVPVRLDMLAAEETRVVDLSRSQELVYPPDANWANVEVTYSGKVGDLIPVAASYDASGRYGVQSPFSDSVSFQWKGGMWHVDGEHNTLITTGNAAEGGIPAQAAITLFYGDGGVYDLPEKALAPGEQMWVEIGKLIRDQIPDKKGHVLPPNVMEGSYEIRDLKNRQFGYLYEGKLITDKTFGHASYGCAGCCEYGGVGYDGFYLVPNPMSGGVGGSGLFDPFATNQCTGEDDPVAAIFTSSSNPPVATVNSSGLTSFLSVGTSNITATARLQSTQNPSCRPQTYWTWAPTCVGNLAFNGTTNDFIFVGTDPNILSANTYFLTATPAGGSYGGSSSDPNDTVTLSSSSGLEKAVAKTGDQSANVGDRTLTFTYTPPSCPAFTLTKSVTARQFAWVTNGPLSNVCSAGYGYQYQIVYTPYTHPDNAVVPEGIGLTGTLVNETIAPQSGGTVCTNYSETGDGSLNANSQFVDKVALCSNSPIPACDKKYTQTYTIAQSPPSTPVRTNTLEFTNTVLKFTNQGPTK